MPSGTGGCDFAARPSLSALEQPVFWSPRADTGVVTIGTAPEFLAGAPSHEPLHPNGERHSPEGIHAFATSLPVQLLLLPGGDLEHPLAALIPLDAETLGRIETLTRFWRAWQGRPAAPDTRLTRRQRERFRLMIQAVDGRANGASYREIATVLFGAERVAATPWKTSSLRDGVIGLVEGGKALIAGGYLRLLRHRHHRPADQP